MHAMSTYWKLLNHFLIKKATYFVPNPIETHRQLGMTIPSGCQFLEDVFGIYKALSSAKFDTMIRVMVAKLYGKHVIMSKRWR